MQAKEEKRFKSTIALMRDGRFLGDTFNLESTHTHSGVAVTMWGHRKRSPSRPKLYACMMGDDGRYVCR